MAALRKVLAGCGLAFVLLGCGDDEPRPAVSTDSGPAATAAGQLLTYEDIGPGYVPVPYEVADPSVPAPCGGASADSVRLPVAVVGAEADRQAVSVQVVEELRVYADDATAAAGFDALVQGFACPEGALAGRVETVPITIAAPVDVSAAVGTPAARIDVVAAEFTGSFVLARSDQTVAVLQVFAPAGSADAPDPVALTAKGVARLSNSG